MTVDLNVLERLAALIARTESSFEEEARTSALLAIRLMRRHGLLPQDLVAAVEALKRLRKKKYRVTKSYFTERGKKGGLARAQSLTAEQRSDIAKRAAAARWHGKRERLP